MARKRKCREIIGIRFGRLVAIKNTERRNGSSYVKCRCDCGVEIIKRRAHLISGNTKSCGCLAKEIHSKRMKVKQTKHGLYGTSIQAIWNGMIQRCNNPKNTGYHYYGGRGVRVCDRWLILENFFDDMGHRAEGKSLDRIDNNGNYEPNNCRWATNAEQATNKRNTIRLNFYGTDLSLKEWSKILNIKHHTLQIRVSKGWSVRKTLTTPLLRHRRS